MQSAPTSSTIGDEVVGTPSNFGPTLLTMLLPSSNRIGLDNDNNAAIIMVLSIYLRLLQSGGQAIQYYQIGQCLLNQRSLAFVAATVVEDLPNWGGYVGPQRRHRQATTIIIVVPTPVSSHILWDTP